MNLLDEIGRANEIGRLSVQVVTARLRAPATDALRRSIGLDGEPPPPCEDPELAYLVPGSMPRLVHGDLPSMLIGGIASLLLQSLHPLAMAGVDQHSDYREDPLGRLERTAHFVGITTYGSKDDAARAIRAVKALHRRVEGHAPDGRHYAAQDPDLLRWVHVAEVRSFLHASLAYGTLQLDEEDRDAYVDQMAPVALDLGAEWVPRTVAELDAYLEGLRSELELTEAARRARDFVLRGVQRWPHEQLAYATLVAAALGTLPGWARQMLGIPWLAPADALVVRPAARLLCGGLRILAPGPDQVVSVRPPSTTTT